MSIGTAYRVAKPAIVSCVRKTQKVEMWAWSLPDLLWSLTSSKHLDFRYYWDFSLPEIWTYDGYLAVCRMKREVYDGQWYLMAMKRLLFDQLRSS
jgi:hypothetical protein